MTGFRLRFLMSTSLVIKSWSEITCGTMLCLKITSVLLEMKRSRRVADVSVILVGLSII